MAKRTAEEMNKNVGERSINIRSIQAASIYRDNNGYKMVLKGKDGKKSYIEEKLPYRTAVISDGIFARYALKHGAVINSKNNSLDFVMVKFDFGVEADESGKSNLKPGISANELRKQYYEDGVTINWKKYDKDGNAYKDPIKYKMLYRTTGKAKQGHCVFCREELHSTMQKYLTMDLWDRMPNENGAKIVELAAYAPMITATALKFINIPIDNIFVVKDEESACKKKAHLVKYENGRCIVDRDQETDIKNTLWDGMGLVDESIFPEDMQGFIYCRSHFFKSCLFRGNIQNYFRDYYKTKYETAYAMDMFGRRMKVSDIKVIVTDNSLKWLKFKELMGDSGTEKEAFKYWKKIMKNDGEIFEIVKTAHESKYGDVQRSSFQMINTLLTTDRDQLYRIAERSIQYCNDLKTDNEKYIDFLRVTGSAKYSINNILIDLYRRNSDVQYWDFFKKKRREKISDFKRNRLQQGKLFQEGDNLTICGNVIALLKKVTGQDNFMDEGCFQTEADAIQCYTERFEEGAEVAAFRSPHNSPNNIVHLRNVYPTLLRKYFPKLGKNVIVINGIKTDVQDRLNGQDLDTDGVYATIQPDMVELAKEAYEKFPTIINKVPKSAKEYDKSMESHAQMDTGIAVSQVAIGTASDVAQLALSYWFDDGRKDTDLEDVFIICSVLAQIAIDSAKRTFAVDAQLEINRIMALGCMKRNPKYPKFFVAVKDYKNKKRSSKKKKEIKKSEIGSFNCPMDIIYDLIDEQVMNLQEEKSLNTKTVTRKSTYIEYDHTKLKPNRSQYKKVIDIVKSYNQKVNQINMSTGNVEEERVVEFEDCQRKMKNMTIKKDTMKTLVAYAFTHADIRDSLSIMLYDKNKIDFLECFHKKDDKNMLNNQ